MERIERRRKPRHHLSVSTQIAGAPERPLPTGWLVDYSTNGVLVTVPDLYAPVRPGDRVVVTLALDDGGLHAIGVVVRALRGSDDKTYVAIEFSTISVRDVDRLDHVEVGRASRT